MLAVPEHAGAIYVAQSSYSATTIQCLTAIPRGRKTLPIKSFLRFIAHEFHRGERALTVIAPVRKLLHTSPELQQFIEQVFQV
jgi:hypothetical protein